MRRMFRLAVAITTVCVTFASLCEPSFAMAEKGAQPDIYLGSPYPGKLVSSGSHGTAVKTVQAELNQEGFAVGAVDGYFGPHTRSGVERFQAAHHLVVDGIVGPTTWAVLFHSPSLLASIQTYAATRKSDVSVALYDKQTGVTYVYNPYQTFDTASIVKLLILATLLHQNAVHHRSLTKLENQLAIPMIEESNNSDATRLWNLVGESTGVKGFTKLAGMEDTTPNPFGYWGLTTTTARDEVGLMKDFAYSNHLLSSSDRAYGLNLMRHVVSWERWGVSSGVPRDDVAIKNGWLPLARGNWEINSIGYVHGSGRDYVIAVLTKGNPSEGYGIATTEAISQRVWKQLGSMSHTSS